MKKMNTLNWFHFLDFAACAVVGFLVRVIQDRKKTPKPDWLFQLVSSVALSYLAYVTFYFYKIGIFPFELWIMGISWMGAFIVTTLDFIAKNGCIIYLRKIAQDFLAYTKKKTES